MSESRQPAQDQRPPPGAAAGLSENDPLLRHLALVRRNADEMEAELHTVGPDSVHLHAIALLMRLHAENAVREIDMRRWGHTH